MKFEFTEDEAREIFRCFILSECYIDTRKLECVKGQEAQFEAWTKEENVVHRLKLKFHKQFNEQKDGV